MPVEVIDTIKPANGNTFPVADVVDLKGVDQNFADVAERDAFDAEKLVVGQRARTRADSKTWEVTSLAPVVWTEVAAGGGAVSSVAGRTGDVVLTHDDIGGVSSGVLLGRHEAGTGNAQHVSLASTFVLQGSTLTLVAASIGTSKLGGDITAAGKAILDDVDAAAQRATMGAEVAGAAATAVSAHTGLPDPHPQYALESALGGAAVLNVGTTAGTVAAGNDSRLSDARTPTAHASTHATGSPDELTPAAIGAEVAGATATHAALTTAHGESAFGATLKTASDAAAARSALGLPASATRTITHSSSPPSGGVAGDIHFQIP